MKFEILEPLAKFWLGSDFGLFSKKLNYIISPNPENQIKLIFRGGRPLRVYEFSAKSLKWPGRV